MGIIDSYIKEPKNKTKIICAKNVALVVMCNRDSFLRRFYEDANLVVIDGRPLIYVYYLLEKKLPEYIGGPNLWEKTIELASKKRYSTYFLGGTQLVVKKAVEKLKNKYPNLIISGYRDGYFKESDLPNIINEIKEKSPDIILLGIATPKKEMVARVLSYELHSSLIVLVGGMFDIFAGEKRRAPRIINKLCLEWLYRLCQEPGRLWKRYLITNSLFVLDTIKEIFGRSK